ncbi:MAG: SufE family protein, partial [Rhodospirillaceae bacterium]
MTASPEAINPLGVTLDELADNFSFLEDWEDRYSYIIDLGKKLPEMPEALKTEETKVRGCMSQVWIFPVIEQGPPTKVSFMADSDAMLVKGLIAV